MLAVLTLPSLAFQWISAKRIDCLPVSTSFIGSVIGVLPCSCSGFEVAIHAATVLFVVLVFRYAALHCHLKDVLEAVGFWWRELWPRPFAYFVIVHGAEPLGAPAPAVLLPPEPFVPPVPPGALLPPFPPLPDVP